MHRCLAALRGIPSAAVQTQAAFCSDNFGALLCGGAALIRLPTAKRITQQETYGRPSTALPTLLTQPE